MSQDNDLYQLLVDHELKGVNNKSSFKHFLPHILPRLMPGKLEFAPNMKSIVVENGKQKEVIIPREEMIYGMDIGPDFCCCFITESQQNRFLTRDQLDDPGFSKKKLLEVAYQNFIKKFGKDINLRDTHWAGVKLVRINGQYDASTFLLTKIWTSIMKQQKFKSLHLIMPLNDMVLIWDKVKDDDLETIIKGLQGLINKNSPNKRISNYMYKLEGTGFTAVKQVFE